MSIYATLWDLYFPYDDPAGGDTQYVPILCQAVPPHVGHSYEEPGDDPYAAFLPPPVDDPYGDEMRAVFIIGPYTRKEGQEYHDYLVKLTGAEYNAIAWWDLWDRITEALPGHMHQRVGVGKATNWREPPSDDDEKPLFTAPVRGRYEIVEEQQSDGRTGAVIRLFETDA